MMDPSLRVTAWIKVLSQQLWCSVVMKTAKEASENCWEGIKKARSMLMPLCECMLHASLKCCQQFWSPSSGKHSKTREGFSAWQVGKGGSTLLLVFVAWRDQELSTIQSHPIPKALVFGEDELSTKKRGCFFLHTTWNSALPMDAMKQQLMRNISVPRSLCYCSSLGNCW